jgi:hypothetical protein
MIPGGAEFAKAAMLKPTWSTWRDAPAVVVYPAHLYRTVLAAVVVGTVLFLINHLDEVLSGRATATVWLKVAGTYLVPFCVSNYGILVATYRKARGSGSD